MRKFLFIIILIPAVAALGHDIYIFTQNQQKGFQLSDSGMLWDKYHKESHDKWKINLQEYSEVISDLNPIKNDMPQPTAQNQETEKSAPKTDYLEEFTQNNEKGKESVITPIQTENYIQEQTGGLQKSIGFLLEQKAVFVFGGFAAIIYFLNALLCRLFREKSSSEKIASIKKQRNKDGGYKYGRK